MRLVFLICFYLLSSSLPAQSVQYLTDMNTAVKSFDAATTSKEYHAVYQILDPIAKTNPTEWLPYYYMSLVKSRMSMLKMGNADELANQSILFIEKAKKIQLNDEVLCGESLAYTAKMSVSPYTRWLRYESKIKSPLLLAKKMNKDNPRVYALEANLQYNMPVLLGGGCANSYSIALIASEKLAAQARTNSSFIMPHWGASIIHQIIKECKKD
jgi:hypothetical protein